MFGVAASMVFAAETPPAPLPSPLTLDFALSLADELDPLLQLEQAELMRVRAEQTRIESTRDFEAYLEARARYVEPPRYAIDRTNDDNRIGFVFNKDLYDFGKQSAQVAAATHETDARNWLYLDARARKRLEITRRYFDVLLADLAFNRNNENMATEYIRFDRLRQRKEVGQASDVKVLEAEAAYQRVRFQRYQSETEQRNTRARLAEALNRPNQLPANLDLPSLQLLARSIPEVEVLQQQAFASNYQISALRARVQAGEQRLEAARAQDNPTLKGNAEFFNYSRETGSNDEARIGVTLTVPLYTGRRDDAAIAQAQAELQRHRALLLQAESEVRQQVLRLWLDLDNLRVQREEMATLRKFRELNLDRSRALYEMEVNADLGDAMVLMTDAEYLSTQTDYRMLYTWLQLDILTGQYQLTVNANDKPAQ